MGTRYHVSAEYDTLKTVSPFHYVETLSRGSQGLVISAITTSSQYPPLWAIKKRTAAGPNIKPAIQCLREIRLLLHFGSHENILRLLNLDYLDREKDVYLYMAATPYNLEHIIRLERVPDAQIMRLTYQILRGLKYIHTANVIHSNLTPRTILIDNSDKDRWTAMITGFGRAQSDHISQRALNDSDHYPSQRWYHAPEILLDFSDRELTAKIDIWGLGCILGELMWSRPLIDLGKGNYSFVTHLEQMINCAGIPSTRVLKAAGYRELESLRLVMAKLPRRPALDHPNFERRQPFARLSTRKFLARLLEFDPKERIGCEDALRHEYLELQHRPLKEPSCPEPFKFDLENAGSIEVVQRKLQKESISFPKRTPKTLPPVPPIPARSDWSIPGTTRKLSNFTHASGSYGQVWKGVFEHDNSVVDLQYVAIKEITKRGKEDPMNRLKRHQREAKIWRELNHPNIAEFIGCDMIEDHEGVIVPTLVSKWYSNSDILTYLENNPGIIREGKIKLCSDILDGLMYLHTGSPVVVHGDLKPANILVDDHGNAVLCDFGMSRMFIEGEASGFTGTEIMGTPGFRAPDQRAMEQRTLPGDVWAFGCICLVLLDGKRLVADNDVPHRFNGPLDPWQEVMRKCWRLNVGHPAKIRNRQSVRPTITEIRDDWGIAESGGDIMSEPRLQTPASSRELHGSRMTHGRSRLHRATKRILGWFRDL